MAGYTEKLFHTSVRLALGQLVCLRLCALVKQPFTYDNKRDQLGNGFRKGYFLRGVLVFSVAIIQDKQANQLLAQCHWGDKDEACGVRIVQVSVFWLLHIEQKYFIAL